MREFSKDWFKFIASRAEKLGRINADITLSLLVGDIRNYIDYLEKSERRHGRPLKRKNFL